MIRLSRRRHCVGLVLTACTIAPVIAFAQQPQPWTVTVTPTLNPLPIGFCAAVQLTVFDAASKDVPRNPTGFRVTMADFDMAVTGASVMGQQIDATPWQVCACQGASPGTMATVIASYPAQSLAAAARVPGVSFQRAATFVLAPPKGTSNPPACVAAAAPGSAALPPAVALPPTAPVVTLAPAPAPAPAAPPIAVALPPGAPPVTLAPAPAPVPAAPSSASHEALLGLRGHPPVGPTSAHSAT